MVKNRLLELDALRGIAAISVVLHHHFYKYDVLYEHQYLPTSWAYYGRYGVELFFIISGFVIFWTLSATKRPTDFVVSRFARLYPTYWSALLITVLYTTLLGLPGREVGFWDSIGNLLMFHQYFGIPHVDGVYWSLTVELTFYVWMFGLYLTDSLQKTESWLLALMAVSILASYFPGSIPETVELLFLVKYSSFFAAGIAFYKLRNDQLTSLTIPILLVAAITPVFTYSPKAALFFCSFYTLFGLAIFGHLKWLRSRWLVFFGTISYPLYLLHQNIGYILIRQLYELGFYPVVTVVIAFAVTVFIAAIVARYLEQPSRRWVLSYYRSRTQRRNPARDVA